MDMDTTGTLLLDRPLPPVAERAASRAPGLPLLGLSLLALAAGAWLLRRGSAATPPVGASGATEATLAILGGVLLLVLGVLGVRGLIAVAPGQARVVQLFGRYTGTVRAPGLHWVNPFTTRRTVSTRIRNHETPVLKVNDADGNPIEMAAVVVWQVRDTARATFAVNDFAEFVAIQAETAVRHIGTSYPYDSRDKEHLS